MSPPTDSRATLEAALRRLRWSVLGLLACCAGVIVLRGFASEEPAPDRWLTSTAVFLGLGTILLRRLATSPRMNAMRALWMSIGSLVLSAVLGLLGVWVAYQNDASGTGILFTIAAALFTIRPTRPIDRDH